MRKSVKWGVMAAVMAVGVTVGGMASIAQDKSAVLKERQDLMKGQAADLKPIQAFAKGDGEQGPALAAAIDLLSKSVKIVTLFPPGTSSTDFPGKTNAKPDIWQNWDKFSAYPKAMHGEEVKLIDAIQSGDRKATGEQLGAVGKAGCGPCHGTFREKMS
jgi:cytochrome c556